MAAKGCARVGCRGGGGAVVEVVGGMVVVVVVGGAVVVAIRSAVVVPANAARVSTRPSLVPSSSLTRARRAEGDEPSE